MKSYGKAETRQSVIKNVYMAHNFVTKNKLRDYIRESIRQAFVVCFQVQNKFRGTTSLKMIVKWKDLRHDC